MLSPMGTPSVHQGRRGGEGGIYCGDAFVGVGSGGVMKSKGDQTCHVSKHDMFRGML